MDKTEIKRGAGMEGKGYYTDTIESNDKEVTRQPLYVNCTGIFNPAVMNFLVDYKNVRKDYYLMYLCRGELTVTVNNTTSILKHGQMMLIPPKTPYEYKTNLIRMLYIYGCIFPAQRQTNWYTHQSFRLTKP